MRSPRATRRPNATPAPAAPLFARLPLWLPYAALALGTLAAYGQVVAFDFVNYDDGLHVSDNPALRQGLTWPGLKWAFTTLYAANWHPLTWLSFLLDYQLFGLWPGGYHLTNLVLHLANVLLLFAVLRGLTGATGRSAVAAALFALHPLHVESVAWVSERKDVLSTLFGLLALEAYRRYVAVPGVGRYLLIVLGMALSLLAKPMLVTLPALLLLLDYWPLRRLTSVRAAGNLVLEKLPLFLLSLASSVVTLYAQQQSGAVASLEQRTLAERVANAVVAYGQYLKQTILPLDLAVFYPFPPGGHGPVTVALTALVLGVVTVLALRQARALPYLLVGWLWYLGTLVPVIGLVQVGSQTWADRYTYVPLIGIFLAVVWGLDEWLGRRPDAARLRAVLVAVALGGCLVNTLLQVRTWQDSLTLWQNAVEVTPPNTTAFNNLGAALMKRGRYAEALEQFDHCLELDKSEPRVYARHGEALLLLGRYEEAARDFARACEGAAPGDADLYRTYYQRGLCALQLQRLGEAEEHLARSLRLNPDQARAANLLGIVQVLRGEPGAAVASQQRALQQDPDNPLIHADLASALRAQGHAEESVTAFRNASIRDSTWTDKVLGQAWSLATAAQPAQRNGPLALYYADQVMQAKADPDARTLDVLAAAQAEAGRFDEAAATIRGALERPEAGRDAALAQTLRAHLQLFERHEAIRQ